jgi:hypothetical protein
MRRSLRATERRVYAASECSVRILRCSAETFYGKSALDSNEELVYKPQIPLARVLWMRARTHMKPMTKFGVLKKSLGIAATVFICSAAVPVQAAFHLWSIQEIYSDASGHLQFIELKDNVGSQNFVGGQTLTLANAGNTITHSLTFSNSLPADAPGTTLLLGTAALHAAGAPTPDFIIPDNFIFSAGGSISFYNASGSYTALPTDGSLARVWGDGNAVNSPQNFLGQTGMVVAPEPGFAALLLCGGLLFPAVRRAWKAQT